MRERAPLVLVVTRSADAAELLCRELRRSSCTAMLARDGRDALRAAAQRPPALIMCDLALADMDGGTMLRALRELPGLESLPAIGLAGDGSGPGGGGFAHVLDGSAGAERLVDWARALIIATAPTDAAPRRPHVLLVAGDEEQRRLALVCLRHAGYDVTPTPSAGEALDLARHAGPDAVVSEVLMPEMDGYHLAFELRCDPRTRRLPIILTCSPLDPIDFDLLDAVGASALVMQTPDLGDLVDAVRTRLATRRTPEPRIPVAAGAGRPAPLELHQLIRSGAQVRERLAGEAVELAFLAGLGVGVSAGADTEQLLTEVLARCAEVTGFRCGAAYVSLGDGPPLLRGHVGFDDGEPLHDFFGGADLLLDAARDATRTITRLPSEHVDRVRASEVLSRARLSRMLVAPVLDEGAPLGMLVLGTDGSAIAPTEERLIGTIAAQVGRWLGRARCASPLSRSQRRTVERLARAAEFRDEETANHTERVSRYCGLLASLSGMDPRRAELLATASTMHDIGKLGIPDSILRKPGPLTSSERSHMQRHAEYGHRILAGESNPLLDLAAVIARTHHERWDGDGYPRGMNGFEIPLEGRIVAIGDVFDALTSDRVYRPAMSLDQALEEMQAGRGTQFDSHLLDLFIASLPEVLDIRRRHPDAAPERAAASVAVA
jgi:response regulator RpfG family c-di-GMP phosphodiesterase